MMDEEKKSLCVSGELTWFYGEKSSDGKWRNREQVAGMEQSGGLCEQGRTAGEESEPNRVLNWKAVEFVQRDKINYVPIIIGGVVNFDEIDRSVWKKRTQLVHVMESRLHLGLMSTSGNKRQETRWKRAEDVQLIISMPLISNQKQPKINYQLINSNPVFFLATCKNGLQRTDNFSQTTTNFLKRFLCYLIDPTREKTHVLVSSNSPSFGRIMLSKSDVFLCFAFFSKLLCLNLQVHERFGKFLQQQYEQSQWR